MCYHHTLGSSLQVISSEPGSITLINMRCCPYAQRTVLCLNAKKLDYEVINSQLNDKGEIFYKTKNFRLFLF